MLFSSVPFLYYFLPAVLLLYAIAPRALKNTVLLLASLVFYAWGEPRYVAVMLISILLGYIFGILIERFRGGKAAKILLFLSVASSLSFLVYFKYVDFFIANWNADTLIYSQTLLDSFVRESTDFTDWDTMVRRATALRFHSES